MEEYRNRTSNHEENVHDILSGSFQTVYKYVYKNNPIVTFVPFQQKGVLFNLQLMKKGKGQLPIKNGKDVNKYGGYNKVTGAFYCVVGHEVNNKKVISIMPVYAYLVNEYSRDPIKYCEDVLNLKNPKMIVEKVLNGALLEINGSRVMITGRTGSRNVYKHAYEFVADNEHSAYLKKLSKYIDRCVVEKDVLPYDNFLELSKESNLEIYDWFIHRLSTNIYANLLKNLLNDLEKYRDKFSKMDNLLQAKILVELLKAFKCDRQCPSIKELNGNQTSGIINFNSTISSMKSVILIHQSVTGLFEVKQDLLKG